MKKTIFYKYFFALLLSLFIWNFIIGKFIYAKSFQISTIDLGNIYKPFSKVVCGIEGYGITYNDQYGLNNIKTNLNSNVTKIVIMGNSHTEAREIFQKDNYPEILEDMLGSNEYDVINFARAGRSIVDHLAYITGCNKLFNPSYFVIQISPADINGDNFIEGRENHLTLDNGKFKIERKDKAAYSKYYSHLDIPLVIYSLFRAETIAGANNSYYFHLFTKIKNILTTQSIANKIGDANRQEPQTKTEEIPKQKALEFLIDELYKLSNNKLVFIYTSNFPDLSSIKENEIAKKTKDDFFEFLKSKNINYIDTTDSFINFYEKEKKFPHGFNNTAPGEGHLNKYGHKIIAKMLYDYFDKLNIKNK